MLVKNVLESWSPNLTNISLYSLSNFGATHLKCVKKNPFFLLQCQPHKLSRGLIYHTILIFGDTIFRINIRLEETTGGGIISNLFPRASNGSAVLRTIVGKQWADRDTSSSS